LKYSPRIDVVKRHGWRKLRTLGGKIKHAYFIKKITYGAYIEQFDYNKVQVAFKSERFSYEKALDGTKRAFSVNRAREQVYQIAEANRGRHGNYREVFFTLTSSAQIKDHKESNRQIKAFVRRFNKFLGYSIKYLIVPELHKSGAIHYHGLFFNMPYVDIKKFRYEIWKFGYVDLQLPKKIKNTSAYIAKYITKEYQEHTPLHTKLFFTARGMFRPETVFTTEMVGGNLTVMSVVATQNYQKTIYKDNEKGILLYQGTSRNKRKRV